ncbi:MAG: Ldh family oxidoreductase [Rhodospirillales bacterium]
MTSISYAELQAFTRAVLDKAGLDAFSADSVTTGLCETSLRGVDSHGIRLLPHYVDSALSGRKNPKPNFMFKRTFPAMGLLDADNGFGHAAGMKAIDHGIEMAKETGIGAVGVANSSHPGAMASFALKAARQGYMAFAFTHADSLLLSYGGTRAYFGTNPICFAAPREEEEPFCLDMAPSAIPWNRLLMHRADDKPLPAGVAADAHGNETTNAGSAASLMPVGGTAAGYKGVGIASMVEVLCGVFTGMAFGHAIPAMFTTSMAEQRHLGQFYMVMRTDGGIDAGTFRAHLQQMSEEVRAEPARPGEQVLLAGDKEIREAARRRQGGIPLDKPTAAALKKLAERFDISLRHS